MDIAQSVTYLTADMCLTADPGVASSILIRSHTFTEIDHEIISMAILLPSADSRRAVVSYKRKYVHEVLVNCLVKLAQEKNVVRWIDCPAMTIAVDWDVKNQTKQIIRKDIKTRKEKQKGYWSKNKEKELKQHMSQHMRLFWYLLHC